MSFGESITPRSARGVHWVIRPGTGYPPWARSIQNLTKVDPSNLQKEDEAPSSKRLLWIAVSHTMVDTESTEARFVSDIDQLGSRLSRR